VTLDNSPAVRLYQRAAFRPLEEFSPLRAGSALEVQTLRLDLNSDPERG
jgi:hypothetical protein